MGISPLILLIHKKYVKAVINLNKVVSKGGDSYTLSLM